MNRYTVLQIQKGALIFECKDCGAVVFHRAVHETWHALQDAALAVLFTDELGY